MSEFLTVYKVRIICRSGSRVYSNLTVYLCRNTVYSPRTTSIYKDYICCQLFTQILHNASHETVKFIVNLYSIAMLVHFYTRFRLETKALQIWTMLMLLVTPDWISLYLVLILIIMSFCSVCCLSLSNEIQQFTLDPGSYSYTWLQRDYMCRNTL